MSSAAAAAGGAAGGSIIGVSLGRAIWELFGDDETENNNQKKIKYRLVSVHPPTKHEKNVYRIIFVQVGKPRTRDTTREFSVAAKNKREAIRKASLQL